MRTEVLCWRWRANPLKRRTDTVESWALLACVALMATAGPLAGIAAAHAVEDSVHRQADGLTRTTGVLVKDTPAAVNLSTGVSERQVRAQVRWRTQDGTVHTGPARVPAGLVAGERTTVWIDRDGDARPAPATPADAAAQGAAAGTAAALGVCMLVLGGHGAVRLRLQRRRLDAWESQWAEVGPKWQQRTG